MNGPMQWTPEGMVPIGEVPTLAGFVPASVRTDDDDDDEDQAVVRFDRATPAQRRGRATAITTPKDVVKAARARLREIDAEVKRLRKLEREGAELRRLLAAAKAKPRVTNVRELPKRSAG